VCSENGPSCTPAAHGRAARLRAKALAGRIVVGLFTLIGSATYAQTSSDKFAEAIQTIIGTAERLCGSIAQSGSSTSVEVKGDVKVELNTLLKRLADLGIAGAGSVTMESYEGVLQNELAAALKDEHTCKMSIFKALLNRLVPDVPQQDPREVLLRKLSSLYALSAPHGVSREFLAGLEWPPEDWLNSELEKRGVAWRVHINGQNAQIYEPSK
jgi:hypothetical protein